MPLTPVPDLLGAAQRGGYALGYFESWSLDSLQGVIDAAEANHAPVIIGFNGEFMSAPGREAEERLTWYGALGRAAAESARVPCGLIFNECTDDAWVRRAITAGFNLVMPIPTEGEPYPHYVNRTRDIVTLAHAHGVAVEAELGTLPFGGPGDEAESGHGGHAPGEATDPQQAAAFVAQTGIDLLAISAGNVHVLLHGRRALDLALIRALRAAVGVPLVLHGGTGIDDESLRGAVALGVAKVNYGTVIKQRYLSAIRRALATDERDPHQLLGIGGSADIMVAGRRAVSAVISEKMALLGCRGKAADHG
jgi:ketose-bisphosphate aldolase